MRRFAVVVAALALFGLAPAQAGKKVAYEVFLTPGWACGSMGAARNSVDTKQYIGCSAQLDNDPTNDEVHVDWTVDCSASNAAGQYAHAIDPSDRFLPILQTINSDSYVCFEYNAVGHLTNLFVENSSVHQPKR
jgi:hypothetical protein